MSGRRVNGGEERAEKAERAEGDFMQPYHDLIVWKEAHAFTLEIYRITEKFPSHERFGVTSQIRRAAVSIEVNLVEGYAKHSTKDCLRYLDISRGSSKECAVLLEIARDLAYLDQQTYHLIENSRAKLDYLLNQFILSKRR